MTIDTDILVSGGGIAGMVAALALSNAGFCVVLVDPGPAPRDLPQVATDTRTTAFLQPSQNLLADIGVWDRLAPLAEPLQTMAIADLSTNGEIRAHRAFDASDVSDLPFGWNLPNHAIRLTLADALEQDTGVTYHPKCSTLSMLARSGAAHARLSDGSRVTAKLIIAADGRASPLRDGAGIDTTIWRYGQKALVFTVSHALAHHNTSTEIHRKGGPFTMVPLPDQDGKFRSSVVWMESGPNAAELASLSNDAFAQAVNERSGGILGQLVPEDSPMVWPIITQKANHLTDQRLALIAEAAHVVPPIGAQGLNMSLSDIRTLRDLAVQYRGDPGSDAMLAAYEKSREAAINTRVYGLHALNKASIAGTALARDLRAETLKLLHDFAPLRRGLMRLGIG